MPDDTDRMNTPNAATVSVPEQHAPTLIDAGVPDLWQSLRQGLEKLKLGWTGYSVFLAFLLYLFGYLALRFHLAVLGLATDINVVDERYVFAGAKFAVYLAGSLPSVVILCLLAIVVTYVPYRCLPRIARKPISSAARFCLQRLQTYLSSPLRAYALGIVLAALAIQLVMRQCFLLSNLLLAKGLPTHPTWLSQVLVASDGDRALYFSALVALTAVPAALLSLVPSGQQPSSPVRFLKGLLTLLVLAQVLLLPINFGTFVIDKTLPRIIPPESIATQSSRARVWLVWEGSEGFTCMIETPEVVNQPRVLLTVPRSEVSRRKIVGYDPIFSTLFVDTVANELPAPVAIEP